MPFVLPEGLAPEVHPLAWLVGRWRGQGQLGYPGVADSAFTQELELGHDGGPYLTYRSTIRLVGGPQDAGAPDGLEPVWSTESGFWRVPPVRPEGLAEDQSPVEALLADPAGYVSVLVGTVGGGRIDVVSDVVARTATGAEVAGVRRMYGLVRGELMWAEDLAAFGRPLQTYASARLGRVAS